MTHTPLIPISAVAPDLQPILKRFREQGDISIEDIPIEVSRNNYIKTCIQNRLDIDIDEVRDMICPVENGEIMLRLYRNQPNTKTPQPVILFIHGGGWVIGNLESHDQVCRYLAKKSDLPVIAVDYRLAPEHKFPIPLNDCITALHYICEHHKSLAIDPHSINVMGDSAGGNLATVLAHKYNESIKGTITTQVLIYPSVDFSQIHPSSSRFSEGFPLTNKVTHWFGRQYLSDGDVLTDPRLSPLLAPPSINKPRTFIVTVGFDPLVDEGLLYTMKLIKDGCYVEHIHIPNQMHGIITYIAEITDSRRILDRASTFIQNSASSA